MVKDPESFVFDMSKVKLRPATEAQLYFIKKHKTELMKLLKNTFVSKEMALEELQNIKSDRYWASYYIGLNPTFVTPSAIRMCAASAVERSVRELTWIIERSNTHQTYPCLVIGSKNSKG